MLSPSLSLSISLMNGDPGMSEQEPNMQTCPISPKSRLAQFKQRYRQFPKLGMKVDVVTDDNGYWRIAL
jgi:hypothetical protein